MSEATEPQLETLLTTKQAARLLGVCHNTMLKYVEQGQVKGYRLHGTGHWRFRAEDLEAVRVFEGSG